MNNNFFRRNTFKTKAAKFLFSSLLIFSLILPYSQAFATDESVSTSSSSSTSTSTSFESSTSGTSTTTEENDSVIIENNSSSTSTASSTTGDINIENNNTNTNTQTQTNNNDDHHYYRKTWICHATGSDSNPYEKIQVDDSALKYHQDHQDREDIIPAPHDGCPKPPPPPPPSQDFTNACVAVTTLGDTKEETIGASFDNEPTLSSIISGNGLSVSTQKQYQVWKTQKASTTVKVTFLGGYNGAGDVFGFYTNSQKSSFTPLLIVGQGSSTTYNNVASTTPGKTYTINLPKGDLGFAIFSDTNSIGFRTSENNLNTNNGDYMIAYDVTTSTTTIFGTHVLGFEDLPLNSADKDYNDVVVKVEIVSCEDATTPPPPQNKPPVITLLGDNPIELHVGDNFIDPGATATDPEDGNITDKIVASSTVSTTTPGTYTITYNVKDKEGLAASQVTRTVNVLEVVHPAHKGKITFCLILANEQNEIATTSQNLPNGVFTINLATTSSISSSTIQTNSWNVGSFSPNKKTILGVNDSDCKIYDNLSLGTYYYSTLGVNGAQWNTPKYNDQDTQPVNNVFDFFTFSTSTTNSDGVVVLDTNRKERTVVMYDVYNATSTVCFLPIITSSTTISSLINQPFSYALTASSTNPVTWTLATSTLPSGLTFSTSTNVISGTPTTLGTFGVSIKAENSCGNDTKTLNISINNPTGGGGGGGQPATTTPSANLSVVKLADKSTAGVGDLVTYTIVVENKGTATSTNVKVTDLLPNSLEFVSATTTKGDFATSTGIWAIGDLIYASSTTSISTSTATTTVTASTTPNIASSTLIIVAKIKTGTEGQKITNTATVSSDVSDPDSSDNTSNSEVNVNPAPSTGGGGGGGGSGTPPSSGGGGGNGPIVGSYGGGGGSGGGIITPPVTIPPEACYYLHDYLRKDFNNNPVEVRKLQIFLKEFEGFTNLQMTGVYDDQTIDAVNVFQMRYFDDVLKPWGHTAPTAYTYILTKKKVNEIYCQKAFPVTGDQQKEIDEHRLRLLNAQNGGSGGGSTDGGGQIIDGEVGIGGDKGDTENGNEGQYATTLAGISSTTRGIASALTANIIAAGKKVGSAISNVLNGSLADFLSRFNVKECGSDCMSRWLNIILILVIILISYLWWREYRNNKKIEDINKEIDLE